MIACIGSVICDMLFADYMADSPWWRRFWSWLQRCASAKRDQI